MSRHLSARETLGWLERLRSTIRDCAARAGKLDGDTAEQTSRLRRQTDKEIAALESHLAATVTGAGSSRDTRRNAVTFRRDQMRLRIQQAHDRARAKRLEEIEGHEGRQIAQVQRELLEVTRDGEVALRECDQRFGKLRKDLDAVIGKVARTERQAAAAVSGYGGWTNQLAGAGFEEREPVGPSQRTTDALEQELAATRSALGVVRVLPPLVLFRFLPRWLLITVLGFGFAGVVPVLQFFDRSDLGWEQAGIYGGLAIAAVLVLHLLGRLMGGAAVRKLIAAVARLRRVQAATQAGIEEAHREARAAVQQGIDAKTAVLDERWNSIRAEADQMRNDLEQRLAARLERTLQLNERLREKSFARFDAEFDASVARHTAEVARRTQALVAGRDEKLAALSEAQRAGWEGMLTAWRETTSEAYAAFARSREAAARDFPAWSGQPFDKWQPPASFAGAAPLGRLSVDLEQLAGPLPLDQRFVLPGERRFDVPLLLAFPGCGAVLFETKETGRSAVVATLNNLVLRILSVVPPGRALFTILDPLDLGQSFAGLMHLADHEDRLINRRIWTQTEHIEQRLAELNEQIEKVTQLYLRNEYTSIAEYNEQAGRIAEPYHFLLVADFPTNFTDLAARRLMSIAASGQRCGVYTFVHWDLRKPVPNDFVPDDLRGNSLCLRAKGERLTLAEAPGEGLGLELEQPPAAEFVTRFLQRVGEASRDSNRVEVPFADITPTDDRIWSLETTDELRVAIGRTGATKLQHLALGRGTRQHVLVAGKTGSGKSTLFHVLVTNLALWSSPDEVEFYLVDFKKGVEFKCYGTHRLPHARVVAIESDREFGLSVLERVDEELRRRGDRFRQLGVQDVAGFKKAVPGEPLPRTLLIIDEFQEFFTEDDRVSQGAALLLDRLVRQGRAFGIHVLLGSQTLGGAYTLARPTLGQMAVRIALQCNEADAMLIMDDENTAPRLLSRPGEAIYNDAAGAIAGNSPFQVVWLSDHERDDWLTRIRRHDERSSRPQPAPVVFEGNAPADVTENTLLAELRASPPASAPVTPRIWLGAPNSIKGPTEVAFHRHSGHHLLIVGQRDESALALLGLGVLALGAQHPRQDAKFVVLDALPGDSTQRSWLESVVHPLPHEVTLGGILDVNAVMTDLAGEFERRGDPAVAATSPAVFVVVNGLQRFKALKLKDEFAFSLDSSADAAPGPGQVFNQLITEGADRGMHLLVWCDTWNNLNRHLNRKAISEFELRVLFQMSATDSASLMDTPAAGNLGLHRAILYNAQAGTAETFRPYALPDREWVGRATADSRNAVKT